MTDPIADMLTRIRNGLAVSKPEVVFPHSRMKLGILEILKTTGYIEDFEVMPRDEGVRYDQIRVILKYKKPNIPSILHLERVSKPGRRVYVSQDKIPNVLHNLGIAVISTSQGLMTNIEAKKRKLGGEIVCKVY